MSGGREMFLVFDFWVNIIQAPIIPNKIKTDNVKNEDSSVPIWCSETEVTRGSLVDKNGYIRCRNDQFGNPKIYYKGSVNFQEKLDSNGESEEITVLKEDLLKLLSE